MRNVRIWAFTLVAVAAVAAGPAGCTSKKSPPAAQPSTSPSQRSSLGTGTQPAPETQESATQHATTAYLNMWNAFFAAAKKGDPTHPDMPKYATGAALTLLTNGLKSNQADGLLERGLPTYHPKVTQLSPPDSPAKALVQDCMDTSATSLYKADGSPYQDTPGGLRLVFADVESTDGDWKATTLTVREVGSCTG